MIKKLLIFPLLVLAAMANYTIVLLGPTRSGKSSFINTLSGKYLAPVGDADSKESETRELKAYTFEISPELIKAHLNANRYSTLFQGSFTVIDA